MKHIYLFSAIISFLLLTSCGDGWLDGLGPVEEAETEKSLNTPTEAEYALNGVYTLFRNYQYYGARYTYYGDAKGEDMQARNDSKRVARYYLYTWNAINAPSNFWSYPYKVIRNANNIINFTDRLSDKEMEESSNQDIRGQALTMRAMAHFDLVKVYGKPYTSDNGASPGVPIVKNLLANTEKPSRNTVAEVYTQIITDLEEASGLLSKSVKNGKLNWFANQLLLARTYLYKGDNGKAFEVATNLISEAKGKYSLFSNAEYVDAWKKFEGSEFLFTIFNSADEIEDSKEFVSYLMHSKGYDDISLTEDYLNLFEEDEGENVPLKIQNKGKMKDIRLKVLEFKKETNDKKEVIRVAYYLLKYISPDYKVSNIPVLRLSEAYLIAAEAAIKNSNKKDAATYLNAIVQRANPDKEIAEEDVTLDMVLIERRKELVGEGHRLFDATRNNQTITRNVTRDSHYSSLLKEETLKITSSYFGTLMPIPTGEMNTNPNMVQNPGFGN